MLRFTATAALLAALMILSAARGLQAQTALGDEQIEQLQESYSPEGIDRALINAVTNNDVKSLALDRELINRHDDHYTTEVDVKGITNQERTGRCWMFAALNLMRPHVIKKYKLDTFEFSQAHLFFWDKLEKANFFLEAIIDTRDRDIDDRELQALLSNPVPDGGWWNYAVDLIGKHGVIPKTYMPETVHSSNSGMVNKIVNTLARKYAVELRGMAASGKSLEELRGRKWEMMQEIYRILVLHFGIPPSEFAWRVSDEDGEHEENTYTPRSFYEEAVGVDLSEYVTLMDYPAFAYGELYQINFCRSMPDRPDMQFINLDIEALKTYARAVIEDGEPVWFAADAGWQFERDNGILADNIFDYESLFGIDLTTTKEEQIRYRVSIANHAMALVALEEKDGRVKKWRVENSWGTEKGNSGYWDMYNGWFDKYVYTVIIPRKYIEEKHRKILDRTPQIIPAWDPLRSCMLD